VASILDLAAASDTDSRVASIIARVDRGGLGGGIGRELSPMPIPITPITTATLQIMRTPFSMLTTSTPIMPCLIHIMTEVIGNAGGVGKAMGVQMAILGKGGGRARYARWEAVSSRSVIGDLSRNMVSTKLWRVRNPFDCWRVELPKLGFQS
jgi:hypothetical protein